MKLTFNAVWFAVGCDPLSHRTEWAVLVHRAFSLMLGKFDVVLGAQPTGSPPWPVREPFSKSPLQIHPLPNVADVCLYAQEGLMVGSGTALLASSGQNRQTCLQIAICLDLFGPIRYDGCQQIVGSDLACQGHSGFRRHNFGSFYLADCADQSNVE
jgi:hypothetical protein